MPVPHSAAGAHVFGQAGQRLKYHQQHAQLAVLVKIRSGPVSQTALCIWRGPRCALQGLRGLRCEVRDLCACLERQKHQTSPTKTNKDRITPHPVFFQLIFIAVFLRCWHALWLGWLQGSCRCWFSVGLLGMCARLRYVLQKIVQWLPATELDGFRAGLPQH